MKPEDRLYWLSWAVKDLASGGSPVDEIEARCLAENRHRVGGELPREYPRIGGGCFVATLRRNRVEIETVLPDAVETGGGGV